MRRTATARVFRFEKFEMFFCNCSFVLHRSERTLAWLTETTFPHQFAECIKAKDNFSVRIDFFYDPLPPLVRRAVQSSATSQ